MAYKTCCFLLILISLACKLSSLLTFFLDYCPHVCGSFLQLTIILSYQEDKVLHLLYSLLSLWDSHCVSYALSYNILVLHLICVSCFSLRLFPLPGFVLSDPSLLPATRQYNYSRGSKVYIKALRSQRDIDAEELLWNV